MSQGKSALGIVQKYHPNVTKVVDAKKRVTISVTEKDCRYARKSSPDKCAMAKACEREYDGAIISMSTAYLIKGEVATRYKTPPSVSREIVSFDRNHDFRPGEYTLNAIPKGNTLGVKKPYEDRKRASTGKGRAVSHRTAGIRSL